MTMEKRGVINENTPLGTCCGGGACGPKGESGPAGQQDTSSEQLFLKFGEAAEPVTEKEADDIESSPMTDAIDTVAEETDKNVE
tara:strand:- start:12391 stop:12642 length:252 start_codon:yes stop_codon:yes gene_type:complete